MTENDVDRTDPWDPELERRYEEAVKNWLDLEDPASIQAEYDAKVFPLAIARARRETGGQRRADLLILPVGTQPYSPTLVAEFVPAPSVGLLATEQSLAIAQTLEQTLAQRGVQTDLRLIGSHGVLRGEVAELAIRIYRSAGEPAPERTLVDITSGRKPTVAALASVADALGARICYLEARFHRHPHGGFATFERLVTSRPLELSAVSRTMEAARALAREGLFTAAARHIGRRGRSGYLPPAVRAARHLFMACDALRSLDAARAARAIARARREQSDRLSRLRLHLDVLWEDWGRLLADEDPVALAAGLAEIDRLLPAAARSRHYPAPPSRSLRPVIRPVMGWLLAEETRL